jgi:hypothetical protein
MPCIQSASQPVQFGTVACILSQDIASLPDGAFCTVETAPTSFPGPRAENYTVLLVETAQAATK